MTNVLFIIQSETMPSSRIRVSDLVPELQSNGLSCDIVALPKGMAARHALFKSARDYSVVVLQKKLLRWLDFKQLRHYAKCLVFDYDDAIYFRCASPSQDLKDYQSNTRMSSFDRIVNNVDLVIAANTVLSTAAKKAAPNTAVEVVPSPIVTEGIVPKTDYSLKERPVIGWIGTAVNLRFLKYIESALLQLQKDFGTILHVIADKPFESEEVESKFIPWALDTQYQHISEFDIGIMPLSSDPFSEGKASFKLLQYLACGLPAVCSPVGMNVEVSNEESNCLMADSPDQFNQQMARLLGDEALRCQLGQAGCALIEETFTTEAVGRQLAEILKGIAGG